MKRERSCLVLIFRLTDTAYRPRSGLPYGVASTVPEAFDGMRGHGIPDANGLQARIKGADDHSGPWPTISVWHGTSDNTVVPGNAAAIVEQWRDVHDVERQPTASSTVDGHLRAVWRDVSGRDAIEFYEIQGMAHGTPLDVGSGYGKSGPFMLDVGISSTVHIARSWGLAASFERQAQEVEHPGDTNAAQAEQTGLYGQANIQSVIEEALRSAGLMR